VEGDSPRGVLPRELPVADHLAIHQRNEGRLGDVSRPYEGERPELLKRPRVHLDVAVDRDVGDRLGCHLPHTTGEIGLFGEGRDRDAFRQSVGR